jgi:hypothetical protein
LKRYKSKPKPLRRLLLHNEVIRDEPRTPLSLTPGLKLNSARGRERDKEEKRGKTKNST